MVVAIENKSKLTYIEVGIEPETVIAKATIVWQKCEARKQELEMRKVAELRASEAERKIVQLEAKLGQLDLPSYL